MKLSELKQVMVLNEQLDAEGLFKIIYDLDVINMLSIKNGLERIIDGQQPSDESDDDGQTSSDESDESDDDDGQLRLPYNKGEDGPL